MPVAPRGADGVAQTTSVERAQPLVTRTLLDELLAKLREPRVGGPAILGPFVAALDL